MYTGVHLVVSWNELYMAYELYMMNSFDLRCEDITYYCYEVDYISNMASYNTKQKHLGCKKRRGQSEAAVI